MPVTFTLVLTQDKASVIVTFSPSALFNHSVLFYEGIFKSEEQVKMRHILPCNPPPASESRKLKSQVSA